MEHKNEHEGRDEYIKMLKRNAKEKARKDAIGRARSLAGAIRKDVDKSGKLFKDIEESDDV